MLNYEHINDDELVEKLEKYCEKLINDEKPYCFDFEEMVDILDLLTTSKTPKELLKIIWQYSHYELNQFYDDSNRCVGLGLSIYALKHNNNNSQRIKNLVEYNDNTYFYVQDNQDQIVSNILGYANISHDIMGDVKTKYLLYGQPIGYGFGEYDFGWGGLPLYILCYFDYNQHMIILTKFSLSP
jgi:hypothetical protein